MLIDTNLNTTRFILKCLVNDIKYMLHLKFQKKVETEIAYGLNQLTIKNV